MSSFPGEHIRVPSSPHTRQSPEVSGRIAMPLSGISSQKRGDLQSLIAGREQLVVEQLSAMLRMSPEEVCSYMDLVGKWERGLPEELCMTSLKTEQNVKTETVLDQYDVMLASFREQEERAPEAVSMVQRLKTQQMQTNNFYLLFRPASVRRLSEGTYNVRLMDAPSIMQFYLDARHGGAWTDMCRRNLSSMLRVMRELDMREGMTVGVQSMHRDPDVRQALSAMVVDLYERHGIPPGFSIA